MVCTPTHAGRVPAGVRTLLSRTTAVGRILVVENHCNRREQLYSRRYNWKLAGSKRSPWFLESWSSRETKHDSSLDYEDAKDLPIELRRLEDFDDLPEPPLSAGLKSRSLGSILNPPPKTIVRSRSSVPSLGAQMPESKAPPPTADPAPPASRRPKLVKQKQSLCDEVDYKFSE
uniref:Uncharacterized protein n=1 Tax=Anopheles atroparvus TaxID=41427 RepID=A0AAG5CPL2_ANOAO